MGLVDNASHIYTVPVLKALNKAWQSFSNIRTGCYKFTGSNLFINLFGIDIILENEELSLERIKKLSNPEIDSNIFSYQKTLGQAV